MIFSLWRNKVNQHASYQRVVVGDFTVRRFQSQIQDGEKGKFRSRWCRRRLMHHVGRWFHPSGPTKSFKGQEYDQDRRQCTTRTVTSVTRSDDDADLGSPVRVRGSFESRWTRDPDDYNYSFSGPRQPQCSLGDIPTAAAGVCPTAAYTLTTPSTQAIPAPTTPAPHIRITSFKYCHQFNKRGSTNSNSQPVLSLSSLARQIAANAQGKMPRQSHTQQVSGADNRLQCVF